MPIVDLMGRSGAAVANAVKGLVPIGSCILILCGCGNNGGDGYAAAAELIGSYRVTVFDVLCKGQKSEAGKYWRNEYLKRGGKITCGLPSKQKLSRGADAVVDAVFGTGFSGEVPSELVSFARYLNSKEQIKVISVDVPLGVFADDGAVSDFALRCDLTVALSFPKLAMFSYPAKEYVGKVIIDRIGIDENLLGDRFCFSDHLLDFSLAKRLLPKREENTNKGSFGKALLMVGSNEFMGASALVLEAALRGGAGYITYVGGEAVSDYLIGKFPEAIYKKVSMSDTDKILRSCEKQDAILIGSGSGCTQELYQAVKALIASDGAPIILDADAINAISKFGNREILLEAKRNVILTPHPLEFSRLSGLSVEYIQKNRYRVAKDFALRYGCVVLLKGAATVITDGKTTFVNSSGSSALAKAGSGDVLAGILVSILAYCDSSLNSAALAAYVHGRAGDLLAEDYSRYGVTPSDIPKCAAKIMAEFERSENEVH